MSLKDLTKEQKQYIVLGCLGAAILLILVVLGIKFSMTSVTTAKEELEDLSGKIEKADQSLARSQQVSKDFADTVSILRDYLQSAPPERNYYSWATEVIYSAARSVGLEIESIDEITVSQATPAKADAAGISLEAYSLRVTAHGGYESTKYFVMQLKRDYPLVRFCGVEISSGQSPEIHDVQLYMQWPFNFGAIAKNWDEIARKQRKVDASGAVAADLPPSKEEPATPAHAEVAPKREPYPPTTKPTDDSVPTPKPSVEKPSPEPKVVQQSKSKATGEPHVATPKPATESEIMELLSGNVPQVKSQPDAEPHHEAVEVKQQAEPTAASVNQPNVEAVNEPTVNPVVEPTAEPVVEAVNEPAVEPAVEPVTEPVVEAVSEPSPVQEPESSAEPVSTEQEPPLDEPIAIVEEEPVVESQAATAPVVVVQEQPVEEPSAAMDEEPVVESQASTALESATVSPSTDPSPAAGATPKVETSRESESDSKPADSVVDEMLGMISDYDEIADLPNTIQASAPEKESSPAEEPAAQPEKVTETEVANGDRTNSTYVATGKSEKIIQDLLEEDDQDSDDASLGSFLNDLMEEIND